MRETAIKLFFKLFNNELIIITYCYFHLFSPASAMLNLLS